MERLKSCIMEEAKALLLPCSIVEVVENVLFGLLEDHNPLRKKYKITILEI